MTDYSRAGSPGDFGLIARGGGGLTTSGANGDRAHAEREPAVEAKPEPGPEAVTEGIHGAGDGLDHLGLDDLDLDDLDLDEDDLDDLDDDEELGDEGGSEGEVVARPREPVPRRTVLVSVGIASVGLLTLVAAAMFALSGIGPIDRPLLISPLGLDTPPGSTTGVAVVPPKPGGKVPGVVGMAFARAKAIVEGAGFRVQARYQQGSKPRETVVGQSPQAGTELGRHGVVTLVVSLGLVEGPVTGPLPTSVTAPPTTPRPTVTSKRPTGTTSRPTVTDPPTTGPATTAPPTTTEPPPPTTAAA